MLNALNVQGPCGVSGSGFKWAVMLAAGVMATAAVHAQTSSGGKTVVVEPTGAPVAAVNAPAGPSPFVVFGQWVERIVSPAPTVVVAAPVVVQTVVMPALAVAQPFEAAPVILGQPDLPLVGAAATQAAQQWSTGLNYQGLIMSYVVLDASGKRREIRPISKGLAPGERFKVRYTSSFEAVASMDVVVGDSPWTGQRMGQVWPQPGTSVQSNPGETVELPLEPNAYFRFNSPAQERYVLSIRHPRAKDAARSNQPAYRQDGAVSSQYLQLIPRDTFASFEQVIAPRFVR